jgi:hypothetical protein
VIPLALLFVWLRGADRFSLTLAAAATSIRLISAANVLAFTLRDRVGLSSLWLIPLKDTLSLFWFANAFLKRTVVWRGAQMRLTRSGRLQPFAAERAT